MMVLLTCPKFLLCGPHFHCSPGVDLCPSKCKMFPKRKHLNIKISLGDKTFGKTRSSWFNSALRDDEAVCWVSIGHYEALAVGN